MQQKLTTSIKAMFACLLALTGFKQANAQFGNALAFDGSNDYVATGISVGNSTAYTIEFWMNPTSTTSGGDERIVSSATGGTGTLGLRFQNGKIECWDGGTWFAITTSNISTNTWTHFALTCNTSGQLIGYVNGVAEVTSTRSSTLWSGIAIGANYQFTYGNYYYGIIDEFHYWTTTRTQAQIQTAMASELVGNETGLYVYYKFNQGTAGGTNTGVTSATDAVSHSNGTLNNFSLSGTSSNWISSTVQTYFTGNANLSALTVSSGTLSPTFASATTSYTTSVTNAVNNITVTPTSASATVSSVQVRVNGGSYSTVTSGNASGSLTLNVGSNTIDVLVTAQDGTTTKTYTISVTRAASSDANLSALSLSSGSLSPTFASGTTSYTASVPYTVSSIMVTPTANQANATIQAKLLGGTYQTVASGSSSTALNGGFFVGNNTINVLVTAQDGTTKTYTIVVTRAAASTDANLSALSLSSGTLSPTFASGTTSYTANVPYTASSIMVTPTANQANATIQAKLLGGTYQTIASGSSSTALNGGFFVGNNTINVVVTAQDGTTTKTYTIVVTRAAASTDANLSALSLSSGTLSPSFSSSTTSYTASVPYIASSIMVTPTANQANATIQAKLVGGTYQTIASGSSSTALNGGFFVGSNTINVLVTAQDGTTTKTYTIVVTRAAATTDATLSALTISSGTLSPSFVNTTTSYTTSVSNATSSITLTPTANQASSVINVNGTTVTSGVATNSIALNVGVNTINVVVTAPDGTSTLSYTISVTRAASSDANLSALSLSSGTLSPTFASGTTSYTANVPFTVSSIMVTPTANQANATIQAKLIGGTYQTVTSGSSSTALNGGFFVGNNTINVLVTAQDGTTKTYTIVVTKAAASNDATLSALTISSGAFSSSFASGTTSYTTSVSNGTSSVTVTPTKSDANATIQARVNGGSYSSVTSGSASGALSLNVGSNTINVLVTAQNGTTTNTYTITVIRAAIAPGNCLDFDGSNDYVDLGADITSLSTGSFTIEAWVRTSGSAEGVVTMQNSNNSWETGEKCFYIKSDGTPTFVGWGNDYIYSTKAVNDNKWHHIAVIWSYNSSGVSGTGKIYVDGVDYTSGSTNYTANYNNISGGTFRIGTPNFYSGEAPNYFTGSIDQVRIYNTALNASDITSNMTSITSAQSSYIKAYYNFDDGTAGGTNTGLTTLYNQTSNAYNGTLANFGLSSSSSNWLESYAMVVPTATAATSIIGNSFTANWAAPSVGTVTNYLLDVSTSSTFSSFVSGYNALSVSGTSQSVTGLSEATTYYYRVRANKTNVTGQGAYSSIISTTTCTSTSSSSSLSICANQLPYSWNGLTFTGAGSQTKTFIGGNSAGCDSSATLTLAVGAPVTPTVSISTATDTICSGNSVTFTATSVNGGTAPVFTWKKNGNSVGSSSSISFPAGTLSTGDIINCVLTANNVCQTTSTANSNSYTMYVKQSPAIGTTTGFTACAFGSTIGIYNTNTQGGGVWSSSNDAVATVTTASNSGTGLVVPVSNGTAVITFSKTNSSNGCVSTASANVIVAVATAPNSITGTNSICKGSTTQLSSSTTGGVWSISPSSYASINSTGLVTSFSTGTVTAKYTITNASGCSANTTYTVTVNAIPLIPTIGYQIGTTNPQLGTGGGNFCANRIFTVVGSPSGGVWSKTGVISVTTPGGLVTTGSIAGAGSLTYTYTNVNGCSSSRTIAGNVVVCASRGVNGNQPIDQSTNQQWTMYPNPAKTFISLDVKALIGAGSIVVTDLYGKQVKTQPLSMGTNTIDVSSYAKGIYFVSTITNEGKVTKKLVVE